MNSASIYVVWKSPPRSSTVIHELAENYERTEGGHPYLYQDPNNISKEDKNKNGAHKREIIRTKKGEPKIVGEQLGKAENSKLVP